MITYPNEVEHIPGETIVHSPPVNVTPKKQQIESERPESCGPLLRHALLNCAAVFGFWVILGLALLACYFWPEITLWH